jgi:hypothetical protein
MKTARMSAEALLAVFLGLIWYVLYVLLEPTLLIASHFFDDIRFGLLGVKRFSSQPLYH